MKNKVLIIISFFFLIPLLLTAQKEGFISGKITDEDGNAVPNANISIEGTSQGTISTSEGTFQLSIPAGQEVILTISCIGFVTEKIKVDVKEGEKKYIRRKLTASVTELQSVDIKDQQMKNSTFNRLDPKTINLIPTANAGIEDLIKTMPGVSSRNELSSQYSVRGGNYDENLIYVNDIEIYRPFLVRSGQQEGLSFLNPDLVSSISFSAGGFDAKYGDKMSSVLDIRYKKPTSFAASIDASLLGINGHLEGIAGKKVSYLIGARYKSNSYFLKGLQTKGSYKPRYFDLQGMINYDLTRKWELSVLGTYSNNSFVLIPESRETKFGTLTEAYRIKIFFDGQESDKYQNWLTAATLTFKPSAGLRLKLTSSAYRTLESETFDIAAEYWLSKLEVFQGGNESQVTEALGVGAFMNHARNYLDGTVFNIEHRGSYEMKKSLLLWGIKYQHEYFQNKINEWELVDSAGYTLPHPEDSLGSPSPPHENLVLKDVTKSSNNVETTRYTGFVQNTWNFSNISVTAGVRMMYSDMNSQLLANPRANISYHPKWKSDVIFRLSGGYYSQPPSFRELTDLKGEIVRGLKAQTAIQAVAGSDYYFNAWERPFKFVTEVYYKYLMDLIPYEVDNLKIRYYGNNDAYGYAAGIDFRVNGEFVKGVESWASLSVMKTMENVGGDWIPRPTDQRFNLSIFFQDYIPHYPSWRMNLTLFYGTGIPFGAPDSPKKEQIFRIPDYRRVDIGLSKQFIGENTRFSSKNPLRVINTMILSLEVFNLLQLTNTVSYLWVTDINNVEKPVPNYLTPRQLNLKLLLTF